MYQDWLKYNQNQLRKDIGKEDLLETKMDLQDGIGMEPRILPYDSRVVSQNFFHDRVSKLDRIPIQPQHHSLDKFVVFSILRVPYENCTTNHASSSSGHEMDEKVVENNKQNQDASNDDSSSNNIEKGSGSGGRKHENDDHRAVTCTLINIRAVCNNEQEVDRFARGFFLKEPRFDLHVMKMGSWNVLDSFLDYSSHSVQELRYADQNIEDLIHTYFNDEKRNIEYQSERILEAGQTLTTQ